MEKAGALKKYRSRVKAESILKSFFAGAIIGFGVATLVEFFSWFFCFGAGLFIAIGIFIVVTLVSAILFYQLKYKPTVKAIAGRIDELGLEERVLTMTELEGDTSYIAEVQRADTMRALGSVNHMLIKFAITAVMIVCFCVSGALCLGMTTVNALYMGNVIPGGMELIRNEGVLPVFKVVYKVKPGTKGEIYFYTGEWENPELATNVRIEVKQGEDAPLVIARPGNGWRFAGWSDMNQNDARHDLAVNGNIELVANFEKVGENEENDEPPESDESNSSSSSDPDNGPAGPPMPSTDREVTNPANMTDNGNTYYGHGFESTVSDALAGMENNNDVSDRTKQGVDDYFSALNPGNVSSEGGDTGDGGGDAGDGDTGGSEGDSGEDYGE